MPDTTLKYFILSLLEDMQRQGKRAYVRTMNTILKGGTGPNADLFKGSAAYGKAPFLTRGEFYEIMDELVDASVIAQMIANNGKVYYQKLSNIFVEDRRAFNKLFGVPDEYNTSTDCDDLDHYYPQRSPTEEDGYSVKGTIEIETLLFAEKPVEYESSIERELIEKLSEIEYIKDIVEQPVRIQRGKNGDKYYTPDLLIKTYHNHQVLIEVKNADDMTTHSVLRKYRLLEQYAYENQMIPTMITLSQNNKQWVSLRDIENATTNIHLETLILDKINHNSKVTAQEYKEMLQVIPCDTIDIHHIILKNNLKKKGMYDKYDIEK
jgi:hypothetical protein